MSSRARTLQPGETSVFRILAIDTSTEQHGLAVWDGVRLLDLSLPGGRQQTTHLLQQVNWLLSEAGWTTADLDATVVAVGPGSFTGLRVGLSIAKGLSIAQGTAVIGVPTLTMTARPYLGLGRDLIVVAPAGRSRLVWAKAPGGIPGDAVNTGETEFLAAIDAAPGALVVGEVGPELRVRLGDRMPRVPAVRSAAALAAIGMERLLADDIDDAASLEPIYLHGVQTAAPPRV